MTRRTSYHLDAIHTGCKHIRLDVRPSLDRTHRSNAKVVCTLLTCERGPCMPEVSWRAPPNYTCAHNSTYRSEFIIPSTL